MTLTVSVIVPWRPDGAEREAAWAWARARWHERFPGWQIVTGTPPDGVWCKAAAVAAALPDATGDVLVLADADVWCEGVLQAVTVIAEGAPWAIPHHRVYRLAPESTRTVLEGAPLGGPLAQRAYPGFAGGGMTVLPRATYERIPLDARFTGWGQEDEAWAIALACLAGTPWRGTAPMWHLWHPPQPRLTRRWGSDESLALWELYHRARLDPHAMRAVLAGATREVSHG
ncbi:hypothetical protein E4N62_46835 [Streptomyces sp. MNU76]|uniref:hypothetical protein n=1 Tax=Streptomyces sp. MNU76 TaxID=2560026 RepID=UPI001E4E5BAF|nr:hypothetical protein [Streptomyces sp. MNU76]MCC9712074.1 hypothetical protein [Streptomyces sp. MNU76]